MLTAIGDVMRECYARGWISTRDGNASVKIKGKEYFHITPSGVRKNKIEVESLIKIPLDTYTEQLTIPKGTNPSGEIFMHAYLLQSGDVTRSVLHVHPTHIVAAAYAGIDLQKMAKEFPELNRYTRVAKTVPVLPATSMELAGATYTELGVDQDGKADFDIVAQTNHGATAIARNPWDAFEHIERLNHICEIVLASKSFDHLKVSNVH